MKIAIGTDMEAHLPNTVVDLLRKMGHEPTLFGAFHTKSAPWPKVAVEVATAVSNGDFDMGVLFCWTGTGISLAANKVKGIRAALCNDAETAAGARKWNNANVLAMSLRSTSEQVAKEMLEAWFSTDPSEDTDDVIALEYLERIENERFRDSR
ncbi:MAG: RpiB/LacA/LacB family sugar-phosphate isomerase [Saprospiraceae bacterium]|jgi:ribose 5-phosphate isomerase B|nr:RpiB/LacA/LacB family sugar-phosphate isomerase [Saprospiraceae bacterium]